MRTQWQILLFIFILNLSVGLIIGLNLAGTEYVSPVNPETGDYEEHFNSTRIATEWKQTPFTGIPLIGDIFAGFSFFWQNIGYLIDGFPSLLYWLSDSYITDPAAQVAFLVIANALRALYALLISTFLIEFISGRVFSD